MADSVARSFPGRPSVEPAPDVAIIGGGIIGCSIAYYLSLAGLHVTVLEREHLAAGASGVAAGMLAPQVEAPFDDAFFDLTLRGRAEHAPLAGRRSLLDIDLREPGAYQLLGGAGCACRLEAARDQRPAPVTCAIVECCHAQSSSSVDTFIASAIVVVPASARSIA